MHIPPIDRLIRNSTEIFKQFLLAQTALRIGGDTINGFADNALIGAIVGINVEIEPIPLFEVKHYWDRMPLFIIEVFHGKLVFAWQECLASLFELLIDKHFIGERQFKELKKCSIDIDFRNELDIISQAKRGLLKKFDFSSYKEKVRLINAVFNPNNYRETELKNIHKHVHIRNSFQHKGGKIDEFFLKDLGQQKIKLLNDNSEEKEFKENDYIQLSIPEFDLFRRSIVLVAQTWRQWNG